MTWPGRSNVNGLLTKKWMGADVTEVTETKYDSNFVQPSQACQEKLKLQKIA